MEEPDSPKSESPEKAPVSDAKIFTSYLVVTAVALIVIVYVITNVMADFILFSRDVMFPGQQSFMIGTLMALLTSALVTYQSRRCHESNIVLGAYLGFLVFYSLFSINMALTAEYHVKGAAASTNAGLYLSFSLAALLALLYWSRGNWALLALVPVTWTMYLLYRWWNRLKHERFYKMDIFGV